MSDAEFCYSTLKYVEWCMEVDAEADFVRSLSLCSRRRTRTRGATPANFFAERGAGKSKKKQEFSIANKLKKQEKKE